jgi:hypothetical protein
MHFKFVSNTNQDFYPHTTILGFRNYEGYYPTTVAVNLGAHYRPTQVLEPRVPIQAEAWMLIWNLSFFYCHS